MVFFDPPSIVNEYFLPFPQATEYYQVKDKVKKMVNFEFLNITNEHQKKRMNRLDIIFCQNVYVYLTNPWNLVSQLLEELSPSLIRGGLLVCSEDDLEYAKIDYPHWQSLGFDVLTLPIFQKTSEHEFQKNITAKPAKFFNIATVFMIMFGISLTMLSTEIFSRDNQKNIKMIKEKEFGIPKLTDQSI
ncbi:MAG: CheR family methyltransferase [Elusimicrobiota bacterium]